MNTLEIPEKQIKVEIPSHWDEMTKEQVHYCVKQAVWASLGIINVEEAKLRVLYHLLDIERDWRAVAQDRIWDHHTVLDKYSRIYLLCEELITFLFQPNGKGALEINYNTVMNYFPEIKAGKIHTLHGPAHLLTDLSMGELRAALEHMNDYFASNDEIDLCRMIACLYRPERANYKELLKSEDFDGKRRQPFNRAKVQLNAELVMMVDPAIRRVIILWFTYTLNFLQSETLTIGGNEVSFAPLFPKSKTTTEDAPRPNRGYGWIEVLNSLATEGPFGKFDDLEKVGFIDVFMHMLMKHEENQKIKAKSKLKKR
jgi:hypothetical protein